MELDFSADSKQDVVEAGEFAPPVRINSAPLPWYKENELQVRDVYLTPRVPSSRSRSSVVNDGGDSKRLAQTATLSSISRVDFDDVVSHAGMGWPLEPSTPAPLDIGSENLGHELREALQQLEDQEQLFLPNDEFERIITRDRVRRELQRLNLIRPDQLDQYADQIWERKSISLSTFTTRRRIFAILTLLDKVEAILDFIQHDLYDRDLPLTVDKGPLRGLSYKRKKGSLQPITFCQTWRPCDRDCFYMYQWQLLAPYFELSTKDNPQGFEYQLDKNIILPFIETEEKTASSRRGGFGDVWRVKIHQAHHNIYSV